MPYRIDPKRPNVVQVKRGSTWKTAPGGYHQSHADAVKHLVALKINVEGKGGKHK
jgi:hypothetical protein